MLKLLLAHGSPDLYYGGDIVRGNIYFTTDKVFRTRSIYVLFHGEEETYIQRQEVKAVLKPKYHGGHMSMETEMESEEVIKREKRSIFKLGQTLVGVPWHERDGSPSLEQLNPGEHVLPFSFRLPATLPRSIKRIGSSSRYGKISYLISVKVDNPGWFKSNKEKLYTINVGGHLTSPAALTRVLSPASAFTRTASKSFFLQSDEQLSLKARIGRGAVVSTKYTDNALAYLPIVLEVNNKSSKNVSRVSFILKSKYRVRARGDSETFEKQQTLSVHEVNIGPNSAAAWKQEFKVPVGNGAMKQNLFTSLQSSLIEVNHFVEIVLHVDAALAQNLRLLCSIDVIANGGLPSQQQTNKNTVAPKKPTTAAGVATTASAAVVKKPEVKNEVAHGKHELENGDVYEGEMYTVTKKPHGAGTMHYKNGDSYQGRWKDGKPIDGKYTFGDTSPFYASNSSIPITSSLSQSSQADWQRSRNELALEANDQLISLGLSSLYDTSQCASLVHKSAHITSESESSKYLELLQSLGSQYLLAQAEILRTFSLNQHLISGAIAYLLETDNRENCKRVAELLKDNIGACYLLGHHCINVANGQILAEILEQYIGVLGGRDVFYTEDPGSCLALLRTLAWCQNKYALLGHSVENLQFILKKTEPFVENNNHQGLAERRASVPPENFGFVVEHVLALLNRSSLWGVASLDVDRAIRGLEDALAIVQRLLESVYSYGKKDDEPSSFAAARRHHELLYLQGRILSQLGRYQALHFGHLSGGRTKQQLLEIAKPTLEQSVAILARLSHPPASTFVQPSAEEDPTSYKSPGVPSCIEYLGAQLKLAHVRLGLNEISTTTALEQMAHWLRVAAENFGVLAMESYVTELNHFWSLLEGGKFHLHMMSRSACCLRELNKPQGEYYFLSILSASAQAPLKSKTKATADPDPHKEASALEQLGYLDRCYELAEFDPFLGDARHIKQLRAKLDLLMMLKQTGAALCVAELLTTRVCQMGRIPPFVQLIVFRLINALHDLAPKHYRTLELFGMLLDWCGAFTNRFAQSERSGQTVMRTVVGKEEECEEKSLSNSEELELQAGERQEEICSEQHLFESRAEYVQTVFAMMQIQAVVLKHLGTAHTAIFENRTAIEYFENAASVFERVRSLGEQQEETVKGAEAEERGEGKYQFKDRLIVHEGWTLYYLTKAYSEVGETQKAIATGEKLVSFLTTQSTTPSLPASLRVLSPILLANALADDPKATKEQLARAKQQLVSSSDVSPKTTYEKQIASTLARIDSKLLGMTASPPPQQAGRGKEAALGNHHQNSTKAPSPPPAGTSLPSSGQVARPNKQPPATSPKGAGPGRVSWMADGAVQACCVCQAPFTLFFRRHHCRLCGKVVCGNCSSVKALPQLGTGIVERACTACLGPEAK